MTNKTKKETSIIIGLKDDKVLLGMKKRGFGEGYWNGFGGKRNDGETMVEAALREIEEEAEITPTDLKEVGTIEFDTFTTHVYTFSNYNGELAETEEMKPQWFSRNNLPYDKMWEGDKVWFPLVLDGKCFDAEFEFEGTNLTECHIKIRKTKDIK